MSGWTSLDALDREAFLAVNGAHAPWADAFMEAVSAMLVWFPLYAFFLYLLQRRFGWTAFAWSVVVVALMVLCSDKGSVVLFKETVQRLRPCHDPQLAGLVHLVPESCGGSYGFVSSHASNHFAIALFMIGVLRSRTTMALALLGWAGLIAYSRVYLGVHYPGDVLVGALYGGLIGTIFARLHQRLTQRLSTTA